MKEEIEEILSWFTSDELETIVGEWLFIEERLNESTLNLDEYRIVNDTDEYTDREFDGGNFCITIMTDKETGKTSVLEYVTMYYAEDGCAEVKCQDIADYIANGFRMQRMEGSL